MILNNPAAVWFFNKESSIMETQIVQENKVVHLTYTLHDDNKEGEVLEIMNDKWPLIFLFGTGKLLPAFEDKIKGLKKGAPFSFRLDRKEAYGDVNLDDIIPIEKKHFLNNEEITEERIEADNYVSVTDVDGTRKSGIIVDKSDTHVTVDFNHALAGKDLYFEGRISHIRPATPDEIVAGHFIEPDGVHF